MGGLVDILSGQVVASSDMHRDCYSLGNIEDFDKLRVNKMDLQFGDVDILLYGFDGLALLDLI